MLKLKFEEVFGLDYGLELILTGTWTPPRPAPKCSNPDDPRFSDDGDPWDYDIEKAVLSAGKHKLLIPEKIIGELEIEEELHNRLQEPKYNEPDEYHRWIDDRKDKDVGSWND